MCLVHALRARLAIVAPSSMGRALSFPEPINPKLPNWHSLLQACRLVKAKSERLRRSRFFRSKGRISMLRSHVDFTDVFQEALSLDAPSEPQQSVGITA